MKIFIIGTFLLLVFFSDAFAIPDVFTGGDEFESRMTNFTNKLVTVLLPILSILGLVYACVLALIGDGGARQRITMVIICSVIGFLAPVIISWVKSISGQ